MPAKKELEVPQGYKLVKDEDPKPEVPAQRLKFIDQLGGSKVLVLLLSMLLAFLMVVEGVVSEAALIEGGAAGKVLLFLTVGVPAYMFGEPLSHAAKGLRAKLEGPKGN